MDVMVIAQTFGLTIQSAAGIAQLYQAFHKTNVEKFFEKLIMSGNDLTVIGNEEQIQKYFFSVIDKVASEANEEKIEHWKNALIHLATDYKDFDFKDNFLRTLDDLTVFDLTVLHKIYSMDYDNRVNLQPEVVQFFVNKKVPEELVMQSIKQLATHNLISEKILDKSGVTFRSVADQLIPLQYVVNSLGKEFIRFISENFIE